MVMIESCGNCKFFLRSLPMQPAGVCRAEPPKPIMIGVLTHPRTNEQIPNIQTYFPQIPDTQWCGEWRLRQVEKAKQTIDLGKLDLQELEGSA